MLVTSLWVNLGEVVSVGLLDGRGLWLTVVDIEGEHRVTLAFKAPDDVPIRRLEAMFGRQGE